LTHKDPVHVEGLAYRIKELSPDALVVVHHDARAVDVPWEGRPPEGVHLVERGRVSWGDWSMIEASQRLLRYAVDRLDAGWFVLLSGEHRPATDLARWEAATVVSGVDALLGAERLPDRLRFGAADFDRNQYLARCRHRWRLFTRPRSETGHRLIGLLMRLSVRTRPIVSLEYIHRREAWAVGWPRRSRRVRGVSFFRGTQWFALNRRAAAAALAVDPALVEWFRESWIPDEAYLHTALRRVPGLVIDDALTTFVRATPAPPYPGWMQLSRADLPAVWASGLPFARKVDPATRPDVVSSIDEAVDAQQSERRPVPGRVDGGA
jgi:hypothetical protein